MALATLLTAIFSFLLALAAVYAAIAVGVYCLQPTLIYRPTRHLAQDPGSLSLPFTEVSFPSRDGTALHGWFCPHPQARGAILLCHGNAGNIAGRLPTLALLHDRGVAVFLFDYRGYGKSAGRPDEAGTYADLAGAWDWLTEAQGVAPARIVLFGRSLGGPIAAWLAGRVPVAGLILESTFTSLLDMARLHYPWLPVRWLLRIRYPTLELARQVSCPVLIAHSPDDETIPYAMGQRLHQELPGSWFLSLSGDHNRGYLTTGVTYLRCLDAFLDAVLPHQTLSPPLETPSPPARGPQRPRSSPASDNP
jgi:hypothetical protein